MDTTTPVLLLGGQENTLAITRSLGKRGVPVHISAEADCVAARSRYAGEFAPYVLRKDAHDHWYRLMIEERRFAGALVLACSDDGIEFIARHHAELTANYLLDRNDPSVQLAMLDKLDTLKRAREAGVDTPNFWEIESLTDVEAAAPEVRYPVMVKPHHSHVFQRVFNKKLFIVEGPDDLRPAAQKSLGAGLPFMLVEMIEGPDTQLSSYYTYITEDGRNLFRFTKRVIRRFPVNQGGACYHITEWLPKTAEAGERFFRGIDFKGLGNIEFKLDSRDGKLKVIECNARFTAAQELLVRCGMDTALIVYCHATGQEPPAVDDYQEFVRLWYPERDFNSFRQLRDRGEMDTVDWLKSVAHRQVTPYFQTTDPMPAAVHAWLRFRDRFTRRFPRV